VIEDQPERYRLARSHSGPDCGGATDVGPVRSRNEDAYWIAGDGSVLVIADGLGGLPAGNIASALAVAAVAQFFSTLTPSTLESLAAGPDPERYGDPSLLAQAAAEHAQQTVVEASRANPDLRGMATTLVIVVVQGRSAAVLHIGDSRAAVCREGRIARMTIDQNGAGDLLRSGRITRQQARLHPGRRIVREVVGLPGGFEAESQTWALEPGDAVVLFTDGVSDSLDEDEVARIVGSAPDGAAAAEALVERSAIASGHDNATAVVRYVDRSD